MLFAGKTVLFELAILRMLGGGVQGDGSFRPTAGGFLWALFRIPLTLDERFVPVLPLGVRKAVYVCPSRALAQEKLEDWRQRFGPLGIKLCELTGDSDYIDLPELEAADIITTTPEK